eukprot:6181902-Pleurochrysis_carterae.AAC.1
MVEVNYFAPHVSLSAVLPNYLHRYSMNDWETEASKEVRALPTLAKALDMARAPPPAMKEARAQAKREEQQRKRLERKRERELEEAQEKQKREKQAAEAAAKKKEKASRRAKPSQQPIDLRQDDITNPSPQPANFADIAYIDDWTSTDQLRPQANSTQLPLPPLPPQLSHPLRPAVSLESAQ